MQFTAQGAVITVVNDHGDWKYNNTWDLNRVPQTGDLVIIPDGITVEVGSNQYNSVPSQPLLNIHIYGVLQFVGTGQLNVQCASTICTLGNGIIPSTGCNCNQITMGVGLAPWKGMANASVTNGECVISRCNGSLKANDAIANNEYKTSEVANGTGYYISFTPNTNTLSIESIASQTEEDFYIYKVISLSGRELPIQKISTSVGKLDYLFLNPPVEGIYIVQFSDKNSLVSTKVFVKR